MSDVLPTGQANWIWEKYLPDIRTTVELFAMHIREVNSAWSYPSHEHLHYEINYVVAGEQITTINGQKYVQHPGDVMLIRPCSPHFSSVGASDGMTYFCLHFMVEDKVFLRLLDRVNDVLHPANSPFATSLRPSIERLIDLARTIDDDNISISHQLLIQSAVLKLMSEIGEHLPVLDSDSVNNHATRLARQIEEMIFSSLNAVRVHGATLDHRTQINQIAKELGIHPSYCNRTFRSVYGVSPRQYMSELVLNHAKTMLGKLELPIEHIATLLGYSDTAQFSRQFKRWTGMSPSEYRFRHDQGRKIASLNMDVEDYGEDSGIKNQ